MADPKGFLTTPRELPKRRPVELRLQDWREVYLEQPFEELQKQAGRCMDCGIPFCHQGCPLGNVPRHVKLRASSRSMQTP
jgi:glutamate synthase (NADPH/NADH) small chain